MKFIKIFIFILIIIFCFYYVNTQQKTNTELVQKQNNILNRILPQNETEEYFENESSQDKEEFDTVQTETSTKPVSRSDVEQNRFAIHNHIGENYLDAILSNGKLVRWNPRTFPLKIYIDSRIPPQYHQEIIRAFTRWTKVSDNFFKFTYTSSITNADFVVILPNQLNNRSCQENGSGVAAYNHFEYKNNTISKTIIDITLTDCNNRPWPLKSFYIVVLHEIGHGLGLNGHSTNPNDLMYPTSSSLEKDISNADLTTLKAIYSMIPDITNVPFTDEDKKNLISSKDYWGEGATRSNYKIEQLKKNIQITPDNPNLYTELASIYAEDKNYSKAIALYSQALKYVDNDETAYKIYLIVSDIYARTNDLERAELILKKATKYGNTNDIANIYNTIAVKYIDKNDFQKAETLLNQALSYTKSKETQKMIYNNFCVLAQKTKNRELLKKYKALYDSI